MKNSILSLALLALSSALSSAAISAVCTRDDLALAQVLYTKTQRLWEGGGASRQELYYAQAAFLDVEYCAEEISQADYCSKKEGVLKELMRPSSSGLGYPNNDTVQNLADVLNQLVALRKDCQTI